MDAPSKTAGILGHRGAAAWGAGLLVILAIAVYANARSVPFLFDDAPAIERNASIRHLWPLKEVLMPPQTAAGATGRPIVNLSLAINYAIGGLNPRGYHAFNVVLHALVGLTLFGLIRRTLLLPKGSARFGRLALPFAFGTTALWIVHPLLTESVVCVVQRNEILVSLFYVLTLYAFVRAVSSPWSRTWQALAVAACALGMASKEVMVTAPLMVLLFDRTFVAGDFRTALRARGGFYAGLAATWGLLAFLVLQHGQRAGTVGFGLGVSGWSYLLTQCEALVTYLKLSVFPYPLVLDYGVDVASGVSEVWWQGLVILGFLATTVIALRRRPVLGFLGAWFFLLLAPSSSFIPLTTQPIAEHRMYLPLVAVMVVVMSALMALGVRRAMIGVAGAVVVLGALTQGRVRDYRSEEFIWRDTLVRKPGNARAHASLGNVFARTERWKDAAVEYDQAIGLRPDYADAQSDYATVLVKLGRAIEAVPHYEAALRFKPDDNQIEFNLATGLVQAGRIADAVARFENVLRRDPGMISAWYALGDAQLKAGQIEAALRAFDRVLELQPDSAAAQNSVGVALVRGGRVQAGLEHMAKATALEPNNREFHSNFGDALFQAGRRDEAAAEYQAAVRLEPRLAGLHYNLGNVWLQLNRNSEAVREYEVELELQPKFAAAHHNLGLALTRLGRAAEAIPHFEETLRQLPESAAAHHNLAVALDLVGRREEAISHEEEALRFQADFPAARGNLERWRAGR